MTTPVNPAIASISSPPVQEAFDWLEGVEFPADRPLINVSQAAPTAPPPKDLRAAIADAALNNPAAHLYGPILGLPGLRAELARQWAATYGGRILPQQVAITSGCNQAFTAVMTTLAGAGDEVILPTPWYFNHKMHLDMAGVRAIPLATGKNLLPDASRAAALITDKTRAIVLVTPNNPTGHEYPADLLRRFYDLARSHGLALVVDATYRDFDSRTGAPHELFSEPDWDQTLIQLYSYSKAYRMTGHRVGAVVSSQARLRQVEKYLDTVTICPNQLGQIGALWGMKHLDVWLAGERAEILARRRAIEQGFARLGGWHLLGLGAYFAYVSHPYDMPSDILARKLVQAAGVLMLPGTMFRPPADAPGQRELRIAFANIDSAGIDELFSRLENLSL